MRRAWAIAALAAVIAIASAGPGAPAAQTPTGSIALASQTTFRSAEQPYALALRVRTSSTATLEVAISTYRRLRARSEFVAAVDNRLPTRTPVDLQRVALATAPTDADGNVLVSVQPRATQDGVYPVRVELRDTDGGNVVDGFTTFFVTVPAVVEADPLDVALVLPVHARPAVQPDGTTKVNAPRADALADMARELRDHTAVPLTLLPTGETLDALGDSERAADQDTVTTLAAATTGRTVVATTYVPADIRALVAGNLAGELNAQLARGASAVETALGARPRPAVRVLDERVDAATLQLLASQGVEQLVVAEGVLDPIRPPNGVTLTAHFQIAGGAAAFEAASADPGLGEHFTRDLPPELAATHLLADLAVLWLDRPGRGAERRGVVAVAPRSWTPNGRFLDTLLGGLTNNAVLAPVTIDTFFDEVGAASTRAGRLTRVFQTPPSSTGLNSAGIRSARRRVEAFASIVPAENEALDAIDRTLLASQSSDVRATTRAAYLRGVDDQVAKQLESIEMPEHRSITLTAREGELPITITNRLPYAVKVVLTLESDALDFPGGASRTLDLARENTTERFPIHARGSGSFPVTVRVEAPEGRLVLAESRFTVRSTAVSGVGILLSVGAAAFLVVWWASHLRTRRRNATA